MLPRLWPATKVQPAYQPLQIKLRARTRGPRRHGPGIPCSPEPHQTCSTQASRRLSPAWMASASPMPATRTRRRCPAEHGIPPISIALGASYFQRLLVHNPHMQASSPVAQGLQTSGLQALQCPALASLVICGSPARASLAPCLQLMRRLPSPVPMQEVAKACGFFISTYPAGPAACGQQVTALMRQQTWEPHASAQPGPAPRRHRVVPLPGWQCGRTNTPATPLPWLPRLHAPTRGQRRIDLPAMPRQGADTPASGTIPNRSA